MGCKYCTEYEDLPEHVLNHKFFGKVFDTSIQEDENGWHIELPSGNDIGIKFCPYCGRELLRTCKEYTDPEIEIMTFKEQMTEKANKKHETAYQIKEHVENIKNGIERFYYNRSFTIYLISPNDKYFTIGANPVNKYEAIIPKDIDPKVYRRILADAIKELGFGDEDISYSEQYNSQSGNSYNITLRW